MGGGSEKSSAGKKRQRNEEEEWEDVPLGEGADSEDVDVVEGKRQGKGRRIETVGKKGMYRKGRGRKASGQQWSR